MKTIEVLKQINKMRLINIVLFILTNIVYFVIIIVAIQKGQHNEAGILVLIQGFIFYMNISNSVGTYYEFKRLKEQK